MLSINFVLVKLALRFISKQIKQKERNNTPPFDYLAVEGAVRKPDIFPTTITSCSSEQKAGLTQSSSAQSLELPVHID